MRRESTHTPYRTWCQHCLQSKAKQSPLTIVADKVPVSQLDYTFMRIAEEPEQRATVLTAVDIQVGWSMATVATQGSAEALGS